MADVNINALLARTIQVRDEVNEGQNTANRIGAIMKDTVSILKSHDEDNTRLIADMYASSPILNVSATSGNWGQEKVTITASKKYIIQYSGATVGQTFLIILGDASYSTITYLLQGNAEAASGSIEFVATQTYGSVKVYNGGSSSAFVSVSEEKPIKDRISVIETTLSPLPESVQENTDAIEKIEDIIEDSGIVKKVVYGSGIISTDVNNTDVTLQTGETYKVECKNLTIGSSLMVFATDSAYQKIGDYLVNETITSNTKTFEYTATSGVKHIATYTSAGNGTIQIYKNASVSLDIDSVKEKTESIFYKVIGSGSLTASDWTYVPAKIEAGKKYTLYWTGGNTSKTFNVYTVKSNNLGVNLDTITAANFSAVSGSIEWTAAHSADQLKIYSGSAASVSLKQYQTDRMQIIDNAIDDATEMAVKQYPHKGKKILSLGDSYTWHNFYGKYLADETGCTQRGRGQNGASIEYFCSNTYTGTDGDPVIETFNAALLNQYDIITIMGGTNDWGQNYEVGSINDDKSAFTVAAHVKFVIDKILTLKPTAKIVFCTQPYRCPHPYFHDGMGGYEKNHHSTNPATLEDVANIIVEVCRYYSIPCYDFYHLSGWNSYNNKVTNPENGQPSTTNVYPPFNDNIYTEDGLHPRDGEGKGAEMLGRSFGRFINNL